MLVITRKQGEAVQIGATISLEIVQIAGNSVRIGITAPTDVRVLRSELVAHPLPEATPQTPSAAPKRPR